MEIELGFEWWGWIGNDEIGSCVGGLLIVLTLSLSFGSHWNGNVV